MNSNTALISNFSTNTKLGWTDDEDSLLLVEVQKAKELNKPLKIVFDTVATQTGRRPNSVRNYYYSTCKEREEDIHTASFVPFTQDEIWNLLVKVLGDQAKGISVRSCTLQMASNDTKYMLRYQNKYRSLIKNNPCFVKEVILYMQENEMPCFDPYKSPEISTTIKPFIKQTANSEEMLKSVLEALNINTQLNQISLRLESLENTVHELELDRFVELSLD